MKSFIFATPIQSVFPSLGLLIYRLVFGGFMAVGHGWGKLMTFSEKADGFPDPLGIGSSASLAGAVASEFLFAALVVLGLGTRFAVVPLVFTMGVAAFVIHGTGPLFLPAEGAKEPALMYMMAFLLLLFTGPGRFSVDHALGKKVRKDG